MTSLVLREQRDGLCTLTLNRPEKLNALNAELFEELREHLEQVAGEGSTGCVVLTGAGRSFSAGHDLTTIPAEGEAFPTEEPETIDLLESLPIPTVAKVRGHCLTGGLELALGCDFIFAADTAKFGDTHGKWGLAPVWGMSVRLPERVGPAMAKELMFTSRLVDGTTAASIGLASRAAPDGDLDAAVEAFAQEVLQNSWGTNRINKALLLSSRDLSRTDALLRERTSPYGLPEDMAERMAKSGR